MIYLDQFDRLPRTKYIRRTKKKMSRWKQKESGYDRNDDDDDDGSRKKSYMKKNETK